MVGKNNLWGYIDKTGKFIIKPVYKDAWPFKNGLARVKKEHSWMYIDKAGEIIHPRFEDTHEFHEGMEPVEIKGKWGYVNKANRFIIAPEFDSAGPFKSIQ